MLLFTRTALYCVAVMQEATGPGMSFDPLSVVAT